MKYPVTVASIAVALALSGCAKGPIVPPPNLPPDVQAELSCVESELLTGEVDPMVIAKACTKGEVAIVVDMLSWLLNTALGTQLPLEQVKKLMGHVVTFRVAHPPVVPAGS